MMKDSERLLAVSLAAVMLAGCGGNAAKEELGAVIGAGLGGVAGSFIGDGGGRLVAVGIGTMLGAILGSEVGKSLDRADRLAMAEAGHQALEYGRSGSGTTWRNPDTGNSGEIVPQPGHQLVDGRYCREFVETVTIAGEKQVASGTACRQPDGSWRII